MGEKRSGVHVGAVRVGAGCGSGCLGGGGPGRGSLGGGQILVMFFPFPTFFSQFFDLFKVYLSWTCVGGGNLLSQTGAKHTFGSLWTSCEARVRNLGWSRGGSGRDSGGVRIQGGPKEGDPGQGFQAKKNWPEQQIWPKKYSASPDKHLASVTPGLKNVLVAKKMA